MAPLKSFASWEDYLRSLKRTSGSWAHRMREKGLHAFDNGPLLWRSFLIEIGKTRGEAAVLVAEPKGQVRFVHSLTMGTDASGSA